MKILNLISSVNPAHGGPSEGLRQSSSSLMKLGHECEVATLDSPDAPWLNHFPAKVHAFGPAYSTYRYSRRLVPWLKLHQQHYDAVIVHGLWQYPGLAAWRALRASETPYFVFPHGMLDPWFKRTYPFKHLKKWLYWPWADYRVIRDAKAALFTAEEESCLARESFWLYRANAVVVGYGMEPPVSVYGGQSERFLAEYPECRDKRSCFFSPAFIPKKDVIF
jgi:glycosyltransferase involved in cell wall biosynthesis